MDPNKFRAYLFYPWIYDARSGLLKYLAANTRLSSTYHISTTCPCARLILDDEIFSGCFTENILTPTYQLEFCG